MIPKDAARTVAPDPRDQEIRDLRRRLVEAHQRERSARAEERERFSTLTSASKRFASSMRSRMDGRQRQQRRLNAQYAVSRVLEDAGDLEGAAPRIFHALGARLGWSVGALWVVEGSALRCGGVWHADGPVPEDFEEAYRGRRFPRGAGLPGRVWRREEPCWVEDVLADEGYAQRDAATACGLRCALAFPIQDGGRLVGVFEFLKPEPSPEDEDMLRMVHLVGHQTGQFVERRRAEAERDRALFRERQARRQTDGILESINDAFFAVDRDWRFTYANRRTEQFWHLSKDSLIGKNLWEVFPGVMGSEIGRTLRRAMEERETVGVEAVSPGSGIWVSVRAYPSADGLSVYFQDISERRKTEEALKESEERFRAVANLVPDLLWSNDASGSTRWLNKRWLRYTGQSFDEAAGYGWFDAIHPDDRERARGNFQHAVRTGVPLRQENRVRRADGDYRWFLMRMEPVRDAGGRVARWFGTATDVHEQRTALEALRENEAWLGLTQRAAQSGTWEWDLRSDEIRWSEEHCGLFGLDSPDGTVERAGWWGAIHPGDLPRLEEAGRRCVEESAAWPELEYRILRDGGVRWISSRGQTERDATGRAFRVRGISIDVTEHKEAEAERDRLLAREWVASAEAAERERISRELHDRVAHSMGVAHQSLQLYGVLADRDPARAAEKLALAREMAKTSLESTRNLSAELRKPDAEEGLADEIRHLLDVAVPPRIEASLRAEGDEDAVPGHARGQVFLILREAIRNAVTHSGCAAISVTLASGPETLVGRVGDDGAGFDVTDGHAGVGLRSMRERAVLLGGSLEVRRQPGGGTLVEVSVPLKGVR